PFGAAAPQAGGAVGLRPPRALPAVAAPPSLRRPPDRSRHVRARPLREGSADAGGAEEAVHPPRPGACVPRGRLRASAAGARNVARSSGVGSEGDDPEANAPAGSAGRGGRLSLPRHRGIPGLLARRSAARNRQAEPDPHPGEAARPYAGRGAKVCLWTGDAEARGVPPAGAARVQTRVSTPVRPSRAALRGAAAPGSWRSARASATGGELGLLLAPAGARGLARDLAPP